MRLLSAVCLLIGFLLGPAYAADSGLLGAEKQAFVQGCLNGVKSGRFDDMARQNLIQYGWPEASINLQAEYQLETIKHPLVMARYCDDLLDLIAEDNRLLTIINQESDKNDGLSSTAIKIGYQLITRYFASGLKRLSSGDLLPYFEFTHAMFDNVSPTVCAQLWSEDENIDYNQIMLSTQGFLPIGIQKRYLDLVKGAVLAEVKGWPPVSVIGDWEVRNLEVSFGDHLTSVSGQTSDPMRLAMLLNKLVEGKPKEYCELGRWYYGAIITFPGRDGDRLRKAIADGLL